MDTPYKERDTDEPLNLETELKRYMDAIRDATNLYDENHLLIKMMKFVISPSLLGEIEHRRILKTKLEYLKNERNIPENNMHRNEYLDGLIEESEESLLDTIDYKEDDIRTLCDCYAHRPNEKVIQNETRREHADLGGKDFSHEVERRIMQLHNKKLIEKTSDALTIMQGAGLISYAGGDNTRWTQDESGAIRFQK